MEARIQSFERIDVTYLHLKLPIKVGKLNSTSQEYIKRRGKKELLFLLFELHIPSIPNVFFTEYKQLFLSSEELCFNVSQYSGSSFSNNTKTIRIYGDEESPKDLNFSICTTYNKKLKILTFIMIFGGDSEYGVLNIFIFVHFRLV